MKNIFKYVPIILGLVMVMSSCGDDDITAPASSAPAPTLNYSVNSSADMSSYSLTTGDAVTIAITANKLGTGKDLDLISISQNGANVTNSMSFTIGNNTYDFSTSAEQKIQNADDETFQAIGTFIGIASNSGTTTYAITVKDRDGVTTTKSFNIVVAAPTSPFTISKTGVIYHIEGQGRGSWNLETDTTVSKATSATMADIRNADAAGDPFTGAFRVGTSRTTTTFVVAATGYDFDNATVTGATAAYNAGTAVTSATPTVGAVYIYSVNGTITLVKVSEINASFNNAGAWTGNLGRMTFDYKK
tara:strand:- start:1103 stop:2011 length:909 start_codon:yes stop_codon:yes gene_type:complete